MKNIKQLFAILPLLPYLSFAGNTPATHTDHPSVCAESLSYGRKSGLASGCFNADGIFSGGPGCRQILKLRNLSGTAVTRSDINVDYSNSKFTGVLNGACGIDGVDKSGSDCEVKSGSEEVPYNPLGSFDAYKTHTVFLGVNGAAAGSSPFDGNITINYEQNGTSYTGTLAKCEVATNSADDLCYDKTETDGLMCFDMGDFFSGGIGCKTTISLRNQGDDTLISPMVSVINSSLFGGHMIDGCGIDGEAGSCADSDVMDMPFMGMSGMFMGSSVTYDPVPDFDANDTHSTYTKSLMGMKIFSQTQLLGTYIENGKLYRGEIKPCRGTIHNGYRPFTLRHREVLVGNMMTIGNTILVPPEDQSSQVCDTYTNGAYKSDTEKANNYYELCAYHDDSNVSFPTSQAELPIPNSDDVKIAWAGLYWQSLVKNSYDLSNMSIKIKHSDSGVYHTIGFDQLDALPDVGAQGYTSYSAFKDVTRLFQEKDWKNGSITVGDIPVAEGKGFGGLGTYGAWTLVVMYKKPGEKFRAMHAYDGWQQVDSDHSEVDVPISGFLTPKRAPISVQASVFAAEGDKYIEKDYLKAKPSKQTEWTDLKQAPASEPDQTFYSGIKTPTSFARSPNPVNNQGIDIQAFNLGTHGLNIIKPNESLIHFKFGSTQDRYWPSMITFNAELRTPDLCYDYAYQQNNRYFTEDKNVSQDPRIVGSLFSDAPVKVSLFLKNREASDLVLKNIEMNVSNIDTDQATYIDDTVKYIPPGATEKETPAHVSSSDSAISASVGGLGAKEHFYFYYDLHPEKHTIDMPLDSSIEYDMVITVPNTGEQFTFHYPNQKLNHDIPFCADENISYKPTYGTFNVEESASPDSNPFYNLYTQVARRVDNFKVKAYEDASHDGSYDTPTDVSTVVAVEMIDAGAFHETETACQEPSSAITPRIWLTFDNNISSIDFTGSVINDAIHHHMTSDQIQHQSETITTAQDFFNIARRNTAFRISAVTVGDGELLTVNKHHGGKYEITNLPNLSHIDLGNGDGNCGGALSGRISSHCDGNLTKQKLAKCMECIYGYNLHYTCSRDNFAIRPKAFKISMTDDNTSTVNLDFSNNTNKAGHALNPVNLVAGYPYRIDINSTNFANENPVKGYVQRFDSNDSHRRAYMQWDPRSISSSQAAAYCNTPADNNMTFNLIDGTNTNPNPLNTWGDRHGTLQDVGEYLFHVIDKEWTQYDWDDNLTVHHRKPHFISDRKDCIENSNFIYPIGGRVGCDTSSVYGTQYKEMYIRAYPYAFDVASLSYGARPSNDNNNSTWVYMNTLKRSSYVDGIDTNMSYNIQGTFKAVGYDHNTSLDNYVDRCYAEDVDMHLVANYLSPKALAPQMRYDIFDDNNTNYTYHHSHDINYHDPKFAAILQHNSDFVKELNGSIKMDLGYNLVHRCDHPANPVKLEIKDFNISSSLQPASLYVNGISHHKIYGNIDIDKNVTFVYGRVKPEKFFYDDITTNIVDTPVSVVAFCDLGITEGLNHGLAAIASGPLSDARTRESDWWLVEEHDTKKDGNVTLIVRTGDRGTVTPDNPERLTFSNGIDPTVLVSDGNGSRPNIVNIKTGPKTPKYLILDCNSSKPLYRVRFIGSGNWAGAGKTGHVVDGSSNKKKSRRLEW